MCKKIIIIFFSILYSLNVFALEDSTLNKLLQDFEKNKTTKVTVLFDKCSIVGDKIPVEVSAYNKIIFYIDVKDVALIKKSNESYIGCSKYLSTHDPSQSDSGSDYLNCNGIKIDKDQLVLEVTLNYYKQHKNNYNSYTQNYKCPIDDKNIVTFIKG